MIVSSLSKEAARVRSKEQYVVIAKNGCWDSREGSDRTGRADAQRQRYRKVKRPKIQSASDQNASTRAIAHRWSNVPAKLERGKGCHTVVFSFRESLYTFSFYFLFFFSFIISRPFSHMHHVTLTIMVNGAVLIQQSPH